MFKNHFRPRIILDPVSWRVSLVIAGVRDLSVHGPCLNSLTVYLFFLFLLHEFRAPRVYKSDHNS